jgi:hypothetical protein
MFVRQCRRRRVDARDVLFEGEANHHRRPDRGWTYCIQVVTNDGELLLLESGFGAAKAALKAQGMAPELLQGSETSRPWFGLRSASAPG